MTRVETLIFLEDVERDYIRQEKPQCASDLRKIKQELEQSWRKIDALVNLIVYLSEVVNNDSTHPR